MARRKLADELLSIHRRLADEFLKIDRLEAELKKLTTEGGEAFREDFGGLGYVSVSGAVAREFKGELPVIQTEAWLALKAAEQKQLQKSGLVKVEEQWGRASSGRVTVKAL